MIESWKADLQGMGFAQVKGGGPAALSDDQGGLAFYNRVRGSVCHHLWEGRHRTDPKKFTIAIGISLSDRYQDPPSYLLALMATMSRHETVIIDDLATPHHDAWWTYRDSRDAWKALKAHGLPWLDHHASPEGLIELFERQLSDGITLTPQGDGGLLSRLFGRGRRKMAAHPCGVRPLTITTSACSTRKPVTLGWRATTFGGGSSRCVIARASSEASPTARSAIRTP